MRPVVEGVLTSKEAVRAYHDALDRQGTKPRRRLDEDLELTDPVLRAELL